MSLLLLFLFFSLGVVDGVIRRTSGRESKFTPVQAPAHSFPTECGKQFYQPTEKSHSAPVGYIVGGINAHPNSWPWQVMILGTKSGLCGGTLIDTRHVLTAAHCFKTPTIPSQYKVYVSMHDDDKPIYEEQEIAVQDIWLHEQYNKNTEENDIAVIRLAEAVTISDKINVICLPGPEATQEDEEVWVVGWGDTSFNGHTSRFLKQTSLHTMPNRCGSIYKQYKYDEKKQMCAGAHGGGRDACQGDSGGPLMYEKNGVWYLNGVVSYGRKCALDGYPGVYARVSYYLPWIRSKTNAPERKSKAVRRKT